MHEVSKGERMRNEAEIPQVTERLRSGLHNTCTSGIAGPVRISSHGLFQGQSQSLWHHRITGFSSMAERSVAGLLGEQGGAGILISGFLTRPRRASPVAFRLCGCLGERRLLHGMGSCRTAAGASPDIPAPQHYLMPLIQPPGYSVAHLWKKLRARWPQCFGHIWP